MLIIYLQCPQIIMNKDFDVVCVSSSTYQTVDQNFFEQQNPECCSLASSGYVRAMLSQTPKGKGQEVDRGMKAFSFPKSVIKSA